MLLVASSHGAFYASYFVHRPLVRGKGGKGRCDIRGTAETDEWNLLTLLPHMNDLIEKANHPLETG